MINLVIIFSDVIFDFNKLLLHLDGLVFYLLLLSLNILNLNPALQVLLFALHDCSNLEQ